ncbi:pseudaminic acid synthase [Acetoanaerobium sticklandii]|uniref:pseudaminic acid synthase n=1 Tax=Acetoanaerobium sticklandii TaxID=1511 RepID=UPI003A91451C
MFKKPYFIAEMSGNHNQSLERALEIVDAAAASGADALKIQTYTPDTMTIDVREKGFVIEDKNSLWFGKSLYELYGEAMTPYEWHGPIFERCKEHGMDFLSTPFDSTAVDFLETFNPKLYKIASFENIDIPLIKKVASLKKPLIISTGMATVSEIEDAVSAARSVGCEDITLLKCTSAYPADASDANIATIPHLKNIFHTNVGLSDHTTGVGVAVAAIALGATVVEKHFTLNRADGGVDSAFSLEPHEFKALVEEGTKAYNSIGNINYGTSSDKEKSSLGFRRSMYIVKDVVKGEEITPENVRCIRPGFGLAPKYYDLVMGRTFKEDYKKGTPLSFDKM